MARAISGCEVWQQDFLRLDLPAAGSTAYSPTRRCFTCRARDLPRVLRELRAALKPRGVLFCSNPHGHDDEGWNRGRYGVYHAPATWRAYGAAGGLCRNRALLSTARIAARAAAVARYRLAEGDNLAAGYRPRGANETRSPRSQSGLIRQKLETVNSRLSRLPVVLLSLMLLAVPGSPSRAQSPAPAGNARVIVKYKADSPLLRRETLAAGSPRMSGREALAQRVGLPLRAGADVAERTQVLFASGMTSRAARSASCPRERRRVRGAGRAPPRFVAAQRSAVPDGPGHRRQHGWAGGGSVVSARAGAAKCSRRIDVEPAWNLHHRQPGVVVAVLDTGVRFDHPDLLRVGAGGNLLPGYDMIQRSPTSPTTATAATPTPPTPVTGSRRPRSPQAGGPFDDCGNVARTARGTARRRPASSPR